MKNSTIVPQNKEPERLTEFIAWHWYDFTCPFCYVSKSRNRLLEENGFHLIALPFQAHPDVPAEGVYMGVRTGPMYEMLEKEAKDMNLPLKWPVRLPNSQYALTIAETIRRHIPEVFSPVKDRLYAAHFALNEDLGSKEVVNNCLKEFGIGAREIEKLLGKGRAGEYLKNSEHSAEQVGVRGTPDWMVLGNELISGLKPYAYFQQISIASRA